jgi:hypothetical protein
MADVDYGYEDLSGYGYGEGEPETDYDYGDAEPQPDYGYGDEDNDYGYADEEPSKPVEEPKQRPKRRCSVTKFNLDNDNTLTAADRIRELRENGSGETEKDIGASSNDESAKSDASKKGLLGRFRK